MAGRPKKSLASLLQQMSARNADALKRGRVSEAKPFIFTKIPRTASESMHGVFQQALSNYIRINQPDHAREFYEKYGHGRVSVCHNHTPVSALVYNRCLPEEQLERRIGFTFIRNPWTRLLSVYNLLSSWEKDGKKTFLHGCRSLSEFVQRLASTGYAKGDDKSLRFYLTTPQWVWVDPRFKFVGRYESIKTDWLTINSMLGVSVPLTRHSKLYNKTAAMAVPAKQQFDKAAHDAVLQIYKDDCFLGGYTDVESVCELKTDEIIDRAKTIRASRGK